MNRLQSLDPRIRKPVSYTHLDVYKRQCCAWPEIHPNYNIKGESTAIDVVCVAKIRLLPAVFPFAIITGLTKMF